MKHHAIRLLTVLAAVLAIAFGTRAGLDKKYHLKTAEAVWATNDSIFNPAITIPDSLLADNSAVIIAWSDDYDVNLIKQPTVFTATGETNRLQCIHLRRFMIKLLDSKAVEDYTEFEFDDNTELKAAGSLLVYSLKNAFGARIHKPDGRIVDVDITQAIEVGQGKKGKEDKSFKIAIPGLEVGDILEYFRQDDELIENHDLDARNAVLCAEYPILSRRLVIDSDPGATVEYKTYNGVPALTRTRADNGRNRAELQLNDMPGVKFERFRLDYRQLPFVRINLLNNTRTGTKANSARSGGLYANIHTGKIYTELADYIHDLKYDCPINGRVIKLIKDSYMPAHPDATPAQLADATYMAMRYCNFIAKEPDQASSSLERAFVLQDVLDKLKIYPADSIGFGFINARDDVPTAEMAAWDEPTFTVRTPDGIYYMPNDLSVRPRELPAVFGGETGGVFMGKRSEITTRTGIGELKAAGNRPGDNSLDIIDTVRIDDDNILHLSRDIMATGGMKQTLDDYIDVNAWVAEAEKFFAIPDNKRYKDKKYDAVGRRDEMRADMRKLCGKSFLGIEPDSITGLEVLACGITPESPAMHMRMTCDISNAVEPLGDEFSLSVGKLMGVSKALTDNERERLLDAMLPFAMQERRTLVVKAPEGYAFDPESVAALARKCNQAVGQFFVNPQINVDGDLELKSFLRVKYATVPLAHWTALRDIIDASAGFADATVLLTAK